MFRMNSAGPITELFSFRAHFPKTIADKNLMATITVKVCQLCHILARVTVFLHFPRKVSRAPTWRPFPRWLFFCLEITSLPDLRSGGNNSPKLRSVGSKRVARRSESPIVSLRSSLFSTWSRCGRDLRNLWNVQLWCCCVYENLAKKFYGTFIRICSPDNL